MKFEKWWCETGSGIIPDKEEDRETHCKRVCEELYNTMCKEFKMISSPEEMVIALMQNEGKILKDGYGRQWKYENYHFYFKDIGTNSVFEKDKISCLHLAYTNMYFA